MCVASFSSPEQKAKVSFWHHLLFYISIFSSRTTVHNSSEYGYDIGGTWKVQYCFCWPCPLSKEAANSFDWMKIGIYKNPLIRTTGCSETKFDIKSNLVASLDNGQDGGIVWLFSTW